MNIGVSGFRGAQEVVMEVLMGFLSMGDIVHVGDARGADAYARKACEKRGINYEVYKAEWTKYGKPAGPMRNQHIVDSSDILVALPHHMSKGTRNAVKMAQEADIPVVQFNLNYLAGSIESVEMNRRAFTADVIKRVVSAMERIKVDEDMLREAIGVCVDENIASTSLIHKRLKVKRSYAELLISEMARIGVSTLPEGSKPGKILVNDHEEIDKLLKDI